VKAAAVFLVAQAFLGLAILLQFNRFTVLIGIASLGVVAIYPLMKRVTWWPQIVLGLAFSWGALMGWPAAFGELDTPAFVLYAGSICWVIGYDTIYAHQDREDDALIGVKSTARLFGARTRLALLVLYALAVLLIGLAGVAAQAGPVFVVGCVLFGAHLGWQVDRLDIDDPELCLKLFKSNRDAGLILFAALIGDAAYQSYFA
jgi:4-hydroxybenzoate polyprenyltransferase